MPELPEIESLTRSLRELVIGQVIVKATCDQPKAVQPPVEQFQALARGTVKAVSRRAKSFIFQLEAGSIWFHVGLRGQVIYEPTAGAREPALVTLDFASGSRLSIVRSFMGHARYMDSERSAEEWLKFGREPLDDSFTLDELRSVIAAGHRMSAKALLMDQSVIAGIGNTYSDEILHAAGLHPTTRMGELSDEEQHKLLDSMRSILLEAIAAGGEPDWIGLDGSAGQYAMKIHRRETCARCGSPSQRVSLQGRTGYFCPVCQQKR